jgi:hypothetical protein
MLSTALLVDAAVFPLFKIAGAAGGGMLMPLLLDVPA